ncbi:hypothetical protein [Kitasatospora sp. NPDC092286]|uniref:hypothetical protein n=1 Tax=Kitasatospora sp. NPDC092286 TaxID=3364087 RepID=UPI003813F0A8
MDLETMPRSPGGARAVRPRGRRMVALAGLVLAAATSVAGCGGDSRAASDAAAGSARPSASAPPTDGAVAPAPVTTPPADPSADAPEPRPTGPAPSSVPSAPAQSPAPTPPGNGIAVGEPAPNGPATHPAITYRVDGARLTVWFYGGICEKYALKADESRPGRVDVRVTVAAPVPSGQVCAQVAKRQSVTADLKQPLAGRAVTDLATGEAVPLEADPHVGPDPAGPETGGR